MLINEASGKKEETEGGGGGRKRGGANGRKGKSRELSNNVR